MKTPSTVSVSTVRIKVRFILQILKITKTYLKLLLITLMVRHGVCQAEFKSEFVPMSLKKKDKTRLAPSFINSLQSK